MDNTNGKVKNGGSQTSSANAVPVKMPKNVRQIGNIGGKAKIIYIEDYVMTFIKQLSDREHTGCRVAILLGFYIKTEESKNIFIKGAVQMQGVDFSNGLAFTDEGWTSIYEGIKKYFTDVEIVGWSLMGPEFFIESEERIRKVHMENFSGMDKILLKMDSMEKEEAFYLSENGQLIKQGGYYIYYEKNEEMQNYMVDSKEAVSEEKVYNDQTTKKIRTVIHEKKDVKDDRNVVRLLYASSALLAIIVLVIAATLLDNYDKLRSMETAINAISENLNMVKNESESQETVLGETEENANTDAEVASVEDSTQVAAVTDKQSEETNTDNSSEAGNTIEDLAGNTQEEENSVEDSKAETADEEGTIEVETVSGNISDNNKEESAKAEEDNTKIASNDTKSTDSDNGQKEEDSASASAQVKYYTVQAGDSLASISYKLYNTFSYMDEIKELNGIEDADMIYAGQKLQVP